MKTLLEKTRDINSLIQKAGAQPINFSDMARTLSDTIGANVYILSRQYRVLGYAFIENFHCPTMTEIVKREAPFPEEYINYLAGFTETAPNIDQTGTCVLNARNSCFLEDKHCTIIPVMSGGMRMGTVILSKTGTFGDGDLILAEYGATLVGMEILRSKAEVAEELARQKAMVSMAFNSLSYSEVEAVEHIFKELGNTNGLLVASKVADKVGITRSVIVNALRKLESAGVVEVRSLGMKGTYIRILNEFLLDELQRLSSNYTL